MVALGLSLTLRANARAARRLRAALAEQERLATSDGLTGLHNQRFLDEMLKLEVERARRHDRPVGMIILDLDGLAEVNHLHGRAGGDRVLVEAATRLLRCVRSSDVLARYGGDEFAAVLADADSETVLEVAERCRASIAGTAFALASQQATVTASAGVACAPEHAQTPAELIGAAQDAAALAKVEGRDAVRLADAPGAHAHALPSLEGVGVITYLESIADEVDRRQGVSGHSLACAAWAGMLADAVGLDDAARWRCVAACRFHDVGKITIDEAVLCKTGRLSEEEWRRLREHPVQGARLVELATTLADVAPVIAEHHERPDGRGFPGGQDRRRDRDRGTHRLRVRRLGGDARRSPLSQRPEPGRGPRRAARRQRHPVRLRDRERISGPACGQAPVGRRGAAHRRRGARDRASPGGLAAAAGADRHLR